MKKILATLVLAVIAMGNATAGDIEQRISALMKLAPTTDFKLMVIPSSGSFFSNKIIVGSLKAGTDSQSSEQIARMLSGQNAFRLAITSENDAVGAATLGRALASLKEKPSAAHEIAFIGDKEFEETLTTKAAEAGIKLLYVPYP